MNLVNPNLSDTTILRVKDGWAARMQCSPDVFRGHNVIIVPREGSSTVIALNLLGSIVVTCPPKLEPLLSPLSPSEVMEMTVLLHILARFDPDPFGTASISYTEGGSLGARVEKSLAHSATVEEFKEVMGDATQAEQEESGLIEMPFRFAVQSNQGRPAALAGYEVWNSDLAQVGVLTAAKQRGQGHGFIVSAAAATAAIHAGLVPQWRCRIDNAPSQRLGLQLGFVPLGRQLGLALTSSEYLSNT